MRRGAPAEPVRTRWSAPWSCPPRAWWWGRASTSAPAKRTPRCTRWPRSAPARAARRCTARSSRAAIRGRTGPCVSRIVDAGVVRVVAAVEDPNPAVRGRGFAFLRANGVAVDVGLGAESAVALNRPFFTLMREGRPFVVLKAATSSDGYIAEAPGRRTFLTSEESNRHAHRVRAEID